MSGLVSLDVHDIVRSFTDVPYEHAESLRAGDVMIHAYREVGAESADPTLFVNIDGAGGYEIMTPESDEALKQGHVSEFTEDQAPSP